VPEKKDKGKKEGGHESETRVNGQNRSSQLLKRGKVSKKMKGGQNERKRKNGALALGEIRPQRTSLKSKGKKVRSIDYTTKKGERGVSGGNFSWKKKPYRTQGPTTYHHCRSRKKKAGLWTKKRT